MSPETITLVAFAAVCLLLAISKRTRPLIVVVSALWLVGVAVNDFANDQADIAIGLLIVAAGITAGAIRDRKKFVANFLAYKNRT